MQSDLVKAITMSEDFLYNISGRGKGVIYTSITAGKYDLLEPTSVVPGRRLHRLRGKPQLPTDQESGGRGKSTMRLQIQIAFGGTRRSCRTDLKDYDWSLWIDGNIAFITPT
jgi:hypothetical protein